MIYNVNNLPCSPIFLGFPGENDSRPVSVDASPWLAEFPDGTVSFVYTRHDELTYAIVVNQPGPVVTWKPQEADLVKGDCSLQIQIKQGDAVKKTCIIACRVGESLDDPSDPPQPPRPTYVEEAIAAAGRAEAAVSHYPKIVNGVWFVWDAAQSKFVSTGISAQGEDGVSPTVTVEAITGGHRVTITDASGDHTFDVMDGEGGGSTADAVLYTPQTLTAAQQEQARENIGAKPPIYLAWDDTVEPGICEKSATEIAYLVDDGYDVHILVQAFRGYDLRFRSVFTKDGSPVAEFGDVCISEGGLENLTLTVDEQKHVEIVRTPVSTFELDNSEDIEEWESGKAMDAGAAKDALNQVLDDVGDELNSKANASDLARVATTGSYNDLSDKPTIPTVPTLAAVATSGSYNDLSDKPTIPSLTGYATETWVEGKGYQTAQQVQAAIAGIPAELPTVTASDNGKFLRVANGAWAAETVQTWQRGSY